MPLPLLFAVTLFISATLLFMIQPMIAKVISPKFGGTPAVWITCMVYFQAALFAGYTYAHLAPKYLGLRRQSAIHVGLLALPFVVLPLALLIWPFLVLPLGIDKDWAPPADDHPIPWVLALLALTVGLPFFLLSTTAPLLQKWFASTGDPSSDDPYYLYAASNVGSMIALFGYPWVLEPLMSVYAQSWAWTIGYAVLVGATAYCAQALLRSRGLVDVERVEARARAKEAAAEPLETAIQPANTGIVPESALASESAPSAEQITKEEPMPPPPDESDPEETAVTTKKKGKKKKKRKGESAARNEPATRTESPPSTGVTARKPAPAEEEELAPSEDPNVMTWGKQFRWVMLGAVPSSLMLGATTYLTTDIAAIPMLWVIPLALYLLSFILVFSRMPPVIHRILVLVMPVVVLLLLFIRFSGVGPSKITNLFLIHLGTLFLVAMVCHGELARTRPSTRYLTQFYLLMSLGGLVGGCFNAIFAPLYFKDITEYPVAMVVACLLVPKLSYEKPTKWTKLLDLGLPVALGLLALAILVLKRTFYEQLLNADALQQATGYGALGLSLAVVVIVAVATAYILAAHKDEERLNRGLDFGAALALTIVTAGVILQDLRVDDFRIFGVPIFQRLAEWVNHRDPSREAVEGTLRTINKIITYGLPAVFCYIFVERPIRFGLCVGGFVLACTACAQVKEDSLPPLVRDRSFFGVLAVKDDGYVQIEPTGFIVRPHRLVHGTTLHGRQRWVSDDDVTIAYLSSLGAGNLGEALILQGAALELQKTRREALTYYHRTGPIGQVFTEFERKGIQPPLAFIGLGTGTLASYGEKGQEVDYYEIDQHVVDIATNPAFFTYYRDAERRGANIRIIMGDARLQLARAKPDHKYGLIVVDAFSSDAIPFHLITLEAVKMYLQKLKEDGIIAFHISNRYLDLEPVLANICKELKLQAMVQNDREDGTGKLSSHWVIIARKADDFGEMATDERWTRKKLETRPKVGIWTDDYSNLLSVFEWGN